MVKTNPIPFNVVSTLKVEESLERQGGDTQAPISSYYQVYFKLLAFILLTFVTMATGIGLYGILYQ